METQEIHTTQAKSLPPEFTNMTLAEFLESDLEGAVKKLSKDFLVRWQNFLNKGSLLTYRQKRTSR